MTGRGDVIGDFRFLALLGMTRGGTVLFTLTFDSSPIKGEGVFVVVLSCCQPGHRPSGLRIKSAMTCGTPPSPPCRFPPTRE